PSHPPHSRAEVFRWSVLDRVLGRRDRPPVGRPAPRVEPERGFLRDPAFDRAWWLGHASFLLQLAGRSVLIDPVLGGTLSLVVPRYLRPALRPHELPPIDLLLISHGHRDHLDEWTIRRLPRATPVLAPSGLAVFFLELGFHNVREMAWWDSHTAAGGDLEVTLVPARHWTRRGLFDLNDSLWGGWVVRSAEGRTIYHAGDTAYFPGFRDIGERFPSLDLALLPIGAYSPSWFMEHSHMNPEQAGQAFEELGARSMVPMHWGTFRLTDEPLREPIERLRDWWRDRRPAGTLHDLAVGERVEFPRPAGRHTAISGEEARLA
ncbi:MAG: MBL fold metallo-hydrolase, partial [Acidobacteriota bacterium]